MGIDEFLKSRTTKTGYKEEKDPDIVDLDYNIMRQDYEKGVQRGESTGIPEMDENLSWMRGHQNCWTGWANDGKCLSPETEVVMYNGSTKMAKDICVGDQLMGPDSKPRNVLSLGDGEQMMYWIRQNTSDDYRVNESHILSLKYYDSKSKKNRVRNISVRDYLNLSPKTSRKYKGYKASIEYPFQDYELHPYLLGVWLGDGSESEPSIYLGDKKKSVADRLSEIIRTQTNFGITITNGNDRRTCKCYRITKGGKQLLRKMNLLKNKHVPKNYLINSKWVRLQTLAGISDADGYYTGNTLEISQKRKCLIEQVKALADSLGFKTNLMEKVVNETTYYRLHVMGRLSIIPTIRLKMKDAQNLLTGIKIEQDKIDKYNGFTLDGDHLFLLKDYTVTHNTSFLSYMMIIKSLRDGWRWCIWSPEMKKANFVDGKIKTHFNVIAYEMMSTITGKTPYKHVAEKFQIPLLSLDDIQLLKEWIQNHFIFLDPAQRDIGYVIQMHKRIFETYGFDGFLLDPYKNIKAEIGKRDDQHLSDVFAQIQEASIETNSVFNWIAHPKSGVSRVHETESGTEIAPCTQYMLSGGAAWDNSMDGIYTPLRPYTVNDLTDNRVRFYNLKQRMQELTAQRGCVEDITFDIKKRRYIFNYRDPLMDLIVKDGEIKWIEEIQPTNEYDVWSKAKDWEDQF